MNDTFAMRWSVLCGMAGALATACGGGNTTRFDSGGSSDDAGKGGDDAQSPASGGGSASAPGGVLFSGNDDAATASSSNCEPGTYSGPFTTKVFVGDAGPGPLPLMWTGTLTVTLLKQMETTMGGEFPTTTLTIAPGGRLEGMDNFAGSFGADVTGQLDCASKKLQADISNGAYLVLSSDAATIAFKGTASGTYDPAMPPTLSGTIYIVTSGQSALGILGATGTVTATMR